MSPMPLAMTRLEIASPASRDSHKPLAKRAFISERGEATKSLSTAKGFIPELARRHNYRAKRDGFIFPFAGKHSPRRGFTLIELLVVISIIGLLASVGLAAFTRAQTRGRDAKRQADLVGLRSALELYYAENSNYINTANVWQAVTSLAVLVPTYTKQLPSDPKSGWSAYRYRSVNSGTPSTAQGYCLAANLETSTATQTTCLPTVPLEANYNYGVGNP